MAFGLPPPPPRKRGQLTGCRNTKQLKICHKLNRLSPLMIANQTKNLNHGWTRINTDFIGKRMGANECGMRKGFTRIARMCTNFFIKSGQASGGFEAGQGGGYPAALGVVGRQAGLAFFQPDSGLVGVVPAPSDFRQAGTDG